MTNTLSISELDKMLTEAEKAVNFDSEILVDAPKMSNEELQKAINSCIDTLSDSSVNIEIRERVAKESKVMALMALRRPM